MGAVRLALTRRAKRNGVKTSSSARHARYRAEQAVGNLKERHSVPKLIFVVEDGREIAVDAVAGQSVMEAAVAASVPGILAECGGACMCATCHVYVNREWLDVVGSPDDDEDAMLEDAASSRDETSRLSCQIQVSAELNGLVLRVARNGS